jgi:hypothetical protein
MRCRERVLHPSGRKFEPWRPRRFAGSGSPGQSLSTRVIASCSAWVIHSPYLAFTATCRAPLREVIALLAEKAAAGALKIDVNTVLTLVQTTDGLAIIAAGRARGKIVVVISD